jgi:DNA-binding response OmpR family regulator
VAISQPDDNIHGASAVDTFDVIRAIHPHEGAREAKPEIASRETASVVLIVVSDGQLADPLASAFGRAGAVAIVARDPATARSAFSADRPDVVVLDLHLGVWNGFDLLRELRAGSEVPIVVLTAPDSDDDRTRALDMGADDYVSKPFDHRELVTRALGRLRRRGASASAAATPHIIAGGLELDATTHSVSRSGRPLNLTVTEFRLLHHLMANAGRIVETSALLRDVWDQIDSQDPDVLRVTLHRLRRKLGDSATHSELIQTVPGVGILFKPQADFPAPAKESVAPSESRHPIAGRRAAGSIEAAASDRLRIRHIADPDLEALLFSMPDAVLEAFDTERFAATWLLSATSPEARHAVDLGRSLGLTIAAEVTERLAVAEPAPVPRRRAAVRATEFDDPTATIAFAGSPLAASGPSAVELRPSASTVVVPHLPREGTRQTAPRSIPAHEPSPRVAPAPQRRAAPRSETATIATAERAPVRPARAAVSVRGLGRLSASARWTALLLLVSAAVAVLSIGSQLAQLGLLARAAAGEPFTAGELAGSGARQMSIAVALLAAYGATALTFLAWLHGAQLKTRAIAGRRLRYSSGWAIASFFVPIANVIVPYQVMAEIWNVASGKGPGRSRLLVDLWWAAWLTFFAANIATSFTTDRPTLAQLGSLARLNLIADLLGIVAAILAVAVVTKIDLALSGTRSTPGHEVSASPTPSIA